MKRFLQTYGVLSLSLLALFGSGIFIGRMTAPPAQIAAPSAANPVSDPEAWVAAASLRLVNDLQLDEAQQRRTKASLDPVAASIFDDRERALFQMHLRLLELHDTLARDAALDASQLKRLATSRAKLKQLIIRTFPHQVRENPSLAISEKSQ